MGRGEGTLKRLRSNVHTHQLPAESVCTLYREYLLIKVSKNLLITRKKLWYLASQSFMYEVLELARLPQELYS